MTLGPQELRTDSWNFAPPEGSPWSESTRISTAVKQHILTRHIAGVDTAQESAGGAKLFRTAKTARGVAGHPGFAHAVHRVARHARCGLQRGGQPVGEIGRAQV